MKRTLLPILVTTILLLSTCTAPPTSPTAGPTVPNTYTLTLNVNPLEGGSVSPSSGRYESGTQLTLTATPASDYQFDYWSGDVSGTSPTITITMDSNKSVIAHFKVIDIIPNTYTLTLNVDPLEGGSVSPSSGRYESGTQLTLTATPASEYQFDYWSGDVSGTSPTITITMDSNKSVIAHFKVIDIIPTTSAARYPPCKEPARQIGNWELTYEVKITKGSNMAEVTIYLDDPDGSVSKLYLRTKPSGPFLIPENYITNLRSEGGTVIEDESLDDRYTWEVAGVRQAKLLYTVNLNVRHDSWQDTNVEGYSSFASSDWVITAGGLLFIPIGWSGPSSYPHVILELDIPDDWDIYTPYPEISERTYDVSGLCTRIRPRSFIVMGKENSFEVARKETSDTHFTVVAIKPSAMSAQEVAEYVSKLAAEYVEIAACIPPYILGVVAPEPMRRSGGEGQGLSFFISDNGPFPLNVSQGASVIAHEFFHLYQKYDADDAWINEGVTMYYQFYGPLKAGYITVEEFWDAMVEATANRADKSAILSSAGKFYWESSPGGTYYKGALITLALDIKIREDTEGKSSFDDVFRTLNTDFHNKPVSSDVLKLIISSLTGNDYSDFFERYVQGSEYPEEIFTTSHDSYIIFLTQELE